MALLLDTCTFLWFAQNSPMLPEATRVAIESEPDVAASLATAWEIAIKSSMGKLQLGPDPGGFFLRVVRQKGLRRLNIDPQHIARLVGLPWHHRDPFDRLLICQAQAEGLQLVTPDPQIARYSIKTLWH